MENVKLILEKGSWNETDIKILMENKRFLPESALVKLGLATPRPAPIEAVKEPVTEPLSGVAKAAKQEIAAQESKPPKKRVSKSKK